MLDCIFSETTHQSLRLLNQIVLMFELCANVKQKKDTTSQEEKGTVTPSVHNKRGRVSSKSPAVKLRTVI